ncbi:hypothetical protein AMATHDRAFT_55510 [Amanita thiersii Skay4041]|uniref:ThuA-like domain-containing protein n=1 Tax=Amanita thiersii Skay4041 TaxID=703135 RepID=A0A2A9NRC8_9AGAR|nr:hypothetical protein AMATHDRAFT_55510 [Amanita thiersii Skay4041]
MNSWNTRLGFLSQRVNSVLDEQGKAALQSYLDKGGNFVAIHSASDCLRNTSFFGREVGAFFDYHPPLQNATVNVLDGSHPSTNMLPRNWKVRDEMYNFKSDPRAVGAVVVLSADESSYTDDGVRKFDQGTPHPTAWYQTHGAGIESGGTAGRSFYTSLGHLNETWQDGLFMAHVLGGISWVLESKTTKAMNQTALVGNGKKDSHSESASTVATAGVETTLSAAIPQGTNAAHSTAIALLDKVAVMPIVIILWSTFYWNRLN